MGKGFLQTHVFVADVALPINNAQVIIRKSNGGDVLFELYTNRNGITETVPLPAVDEKYSLQPNGGVLSFSIYDVRVYKKGFKTVYIHNVEIFDGETSILPVQLHPAVEGETSGFNTDDIMIPTERDPDMPRDGTGQRVFDMSYALLDMPVLEQGFVDPDPLPQANEVTIPQYITVHLGAPNAAASNVRVPFADYIKNVASSEIFPTWHESALYANIYAQISFALNRVYTVWYRSRGFDFDITNNTAFDQAFVYGRNIFENISRIVDDIFNQFIRRPGRREPLHASYCNGVTSLCDGLSQWGSQELALRGYSPIQILRYYYPDDVQLVESNNFGANIGVFGGTPLKEGSTGAEVRTMQQYLNRISGNFYIPSVGVPTGTFGATTTASTRAFQNINNLIADGIIGKSSWYAITKIYVAVKKLAELQSEGERISVGAAPPTVTIGLNDRGPYVVELQFLLNFISEFYPAVPFVVQDGVFRDTTKRAVTEFQKEFGLAPDGVVGPATWQKLYAVYHSIRDSIEIPPAVPGIPAFPGVPLTVGSRGEDVTLMQNYLIAIAKSYPAIPAISADGIFGPATQSAVTAFQRQFGLPPDGIIGQDTWYKIVEVYNNLSGAPEGTQTYTVVAGDTLFSIAQRFGTTVAALKALNNLTSDNLYIGQQLLVPAQTTPPPSGTQVYTVVAGDTLFSIAQRFGTTVAALKALNNLTSDSLFPGQQLLVPAQTTPPPAETQTHTVAAGDTLYLIARRFGTTVAALKALNNLTSDNLYIGQQLLVPVSSGVTHIVRPGDTLFALAREFGTTVEAIMSANGLTSNVLYVGQELRIPR